MFAPAWRSRALLSLALFAIAACSKPVRDTPIPPPSVGNGDGGATEMVYCRAMKVLGDVTGDGKTFHEGDPVPRNQWIDLTQNASIVVKEAASGREVKVSGPGRARLCVGKEMQTWLLAGYFDALTIGSEPAGSQRIVATPFGAARFGTARMRATVKNEELDLEVDAGSVEVMPEPLRTGGLDGGTGRSDGGAKSKDGGAPAGAVLYVPHTLGSGDRVRLRGAGELAATLCIGATAAVDAITVKMSAAAKGTGGAPLGNLAEELSRTEGGRKLSCAWAHAARGALVGTAPDGGPPTRSRAYKALPEDMDLPRD